MDLRTLHPKSSLRTMLLVLVIGVVVATATPIARADAATCTAIRDGQNVELTWVDEGGRHVIRRNGDWLATPGIGVDTYVDVGAPEAASYVIRTRIGDTVTDRTCVADNMNGPAACTVDRIGSAASIEWIDDGGSHVLRRDGEWLATPGVGASRYTDEPSPAGASYELRTRVNGQLEQSACVEVVTPPNDAVAERVVHVSIDGLRVDMITPEQMPTLSQMIDEGASTLNARTDPRVTRTLPNHTSQFTGLPARVHGIEYNEDLGRTVHDEAGRYVPSVFDVVHDNGGRTAALVTKSKFAVHDRSWDAANGAPDLSGADDGRDKIDRYERGIPEAVAQILIQELQDADDLEFAFLHNRYPDRAGHDFGWGSPEYIDSVELSDQILGQVIAAIESDPALRSTTAVIVVADHGGPLGEDSHADATNVENYTIPFIVWGPTVAAGADLYALNLATRTDPGTDRVWLVGNQPIRGHDVANLALDLLGYPALPGSTFNAAQDLAIN